MEKVSTSYDNQTTTSSQSNSQEKIIFNNCETNGDHIIFTCANFKKLIAEESCQFAKEKKLFRNCMSHAVSRKRNKARCLEISPYFAAVQKGYKFEYHKQKTSIRAVMGNNINEGYRSE